MNYYSENRSPRRWAIVLTLLYVVVIASALSFATFDFSRDEQHSDTLYVVIEEITAAAVEQTRPEGPEVPRTHDEPAPVESHAQTAGEEPEVRTVNQRALFRMSPGADEPESTGNPRAEQADRESGAGTAQGADASAGTLDAGLQGRGLVGVLPKPEYNVNASGKVLIDVTVDASGKVTAATFHAQGSTTNNAVLVEAARQAALKARFAESDSFVQGGTITYIFRMQ